MRAIAAPDRLHWVRWVHWVGGSPRAVSLHPHSSRSSAYLPAAVLSSPCCDQSVSTPSAPSARNPHRQLKNNPIRPSPSPRTLSSHHSPSPSHTHLIDSPATAFIPPSRDTTDRRPTVTWTRAPSHARTSTTRSLPSTTTPSLIRHYHHIVTTTPQRTLPKCTVAHSTRLPSPGYRTNAARLRPARARGHGQRAQSESTDNRGTFGASGTIGRPPNVDLH